MNETLKVLEERRSCRNFIPDKMIPKEDLDAILKAGTYAADALSAENARIAAWPGMGDPFYGAPVILIVLANKDVVTHIYDGALVLGNLMNAAKSVGVDSIWIHRAKEEFESDFGKNLLAKLGIEGNYEGIGHCALGYAAAPLQAAAPRKENYVYYV